MIEHICQFSHKPSLHFFVACHTPGQKVSVVLYIGEESASALHRRREVVCESGAPCCWSPPADERAREKRRDEGTVWSQLAGHVCYRNRERESRKRGKSPSPRQRQQRQLATGLSVSLHALQHLSRAFLESASHSPVNVYTMHASKERVSLLVLHLMMLVASGY